MDDHRQVQLYCQIKLGLEHGQLGSQILLTEQIEAEFSDRHNPVISLGGLTQNLWRFGLPMLGIERMDPYGIAQLLKTICQGANRWNFSRLNAGMHQGTNSSIAPALGHFLQIVVEIAKNDVAVAVNQNGQTRFGRCWRGNHGRDLVQAWAAAAGAVTCFTAALMRDFWWAPVLR